MFVLALLADTIRIPPPLLAKPTVTSVQSEIDRRYPNKIILDVRLVICPYGPPLEIGDGMLVPGDGGAHHQVIFQAVVFRPFVDEVLVLSVDLLLDAWLSPFIKPHKSIGVAALGLGLLRVLRCASHRPLPHGRMTDAELAFALSQGDLQELFP